MNEETYPTPQNLMFLCSTTNGRSAPELWMGCTAITGAPLVGDKIEDEASGRVFMVTERKWLSGRGRKANLVIAVTEQQPA